MIKPIIMVILGLAVHVGVQAQTIVVDNADAGFSVISGLWETGTATPGGYGPDYRYALTVSGPPTAEVRFTPNLPLDGYYYVSVWYNVGTNRASNAPFTVVGDDATSTVRVNQQVNGSDFFYIGQMHFAAGTSGYVALTNDATHNVVMADAVRWEYAGEEPGPEPDGPGGPGNPEAPELRGLWVTRFEWPRAIEFEAKSNIDSIVNAVANANFNTLIFQVRGAMETFYPSPNEPWAREVINYQPQTYDPMLYALNACHNAGLKFHAYINTHTITQGAPPPFVMPGNQPTHQFHIHGNPADPNHSDWVIHTAPNQPEPLGEGEDNYNWAAPGVPSFMKWTRDQVLYVAANYHVDGVHFDRIRFEGTGSYDPISLVRSAINSESNPDNLDFRDWNRDQVTRLLNDIYGAVAEVNYNRPPGKPLVEVSTAPFRGKSQQESVNQMLGDWSALGAQDFFVPQVYTNGISSFEDTLATNFPLSHGRHVVAGMSRNSTGGFERTRDQILKAREMGAKGTVIFSYTAFGAAELAHFAETIYQTKVETPEMPWLSSPTEGIIVGNITDMNNDPVLDAQIQRTGSSYTWLSGFDGFYSMLKCPAGMAIDLTITKNGLPVKSVTVPALTAGEVRRVNIQLGVTAVNDWHIY